MTINLGYIYSSWSYEYDHHLRTGSLQLDLNTFVLYLIITQTISKTGIGAGSYTKLLEKNEVGTLIKPNKDLIRAILSNYNYKNTSVSYSFSRNGWYISNDIQVLKDKTINDLLDYHRNDNKIISRILKLKQIKSKIK